MRTAHLTYFILFVLMVQPVLTNAQPLNVKVKSNNKSDTSVANKTAAKVFFVTQKTNAGRDSIVNPPEGMIIYNTTVGKNQLHRAHNHYSSSGLVSRATSTPTPVPAILSTSLSILPISLYPVL